MRRFGGKGEVEEEEGGLKGEGKKSGREPTRQVGEG